MIVFGLASFPFSINIQVIYKIARSDWFAILGLSANNHFDKQNGCQLLARFLCNNIFFCFTMLFLSVFGIIICLFILKQLFASGSVIIGEYSPIITSPSVKNC